MKEPSIDPAIENKKLAMETEKLAWMRRSFYVDLVAKIALPAGVFAVAWATYMTGTKAVEERLVFDINTKTVDVEFRRNLIHLTQ